MKTLKNYIYESRTKDEIKIFFGKKEIIPQRYIYDNESLDDFIEYLKNNNLKDNEIKFCHLRNNKWQVLKYNCYIDIYRKQDKFLKYNSKDYSYNDIIEKLKNNYLIIVIKNGKI